MRILFIYWFLTYGGVEAVLQKRIKALKKLYPDLNIGVLFLYNHINGRHPHFGDDTYITDNHSRIVEIARTYDLVSIIDTPPILNAMDSIGKPLIIEVHTHYDEHRAYIKNDLPSNTRKILTPSSYFKKFIENEIKNKSFSVDYVYNPMDYSYFETNGNGNNSMSNVNLQNFSPLLWIGRLDDLKNWKRALSIFLNLLKKTSLQNLELFIVGRHNNLAEAIDTFKKWGLMQRIRYIPSIDFSLMPHLYREVAARGGIYLSTSRAESFGMTVAESMASGLPCVLNKLEVFEEVSDNKAVYYDTDDEAVTGIIRLLKDRKFYMDSAKNLKDVARRYYPDDIARDLYNKFQQALA